MERIIWLTMLIKGHRMDALVTKGATMAYTKEWYEANKDKIAERRRHRYHNDPEYRAAVLEQSRQYHEKKKAEIEALTPPPHIEIDGVTVPAMTLEDLESETGVDKPRLKYLQKAGYLPPALISRPARLYTLGQVELIKGLEAYLATNSKFLRSTRTEEGQAARAGLDSLVQDIHENWSK